MPNMLHYYEDNSLTLITYYHNNSIIILLSPIFIISILWGNGIFFTFIRMDTFVTWYLRTKVRRYFFGPAAK